MSEASRKLEVAKKALLSCEPANEVAKKPTLVKLPPKAVTNVTHQHSAPGKSTAKSREHSKNSSAASKSLVREQHIVEERPLPAYMRSDPAGRIQGIDYYRELQNRIEAEKARDVMINIPRRTIGNPSDANVKPPRAVSCNCKRKGDCSILRCACFRSGAVCTSNCFCCRSNKKCENSNGPEFLEMRHLSILKSLQTPFTQRHLAAITASEQPSSVQQSHKKGSMQQDQQRSPAQEQPSQSTAVGAHLRSFVGQYPPILGLDEDPLRFLKPGDLVAGNPPINGLAFFVGNGTRQTQDVSLLLESKRKRKDVSMHYAKAKALEYLKESFGDLREKQEGMQSGDDELVSNDVLPSLANDMMHLAEVMQTAKLEAMTELRPVGGFFWRKTSKKSSKDDKDNQDTEMMEDNCELLCDEEAGPNKKARILEEDELQEKTIRAHQQTALLRAATQLIREQTRRFAQQRHLREKKQNVRMEHIKNQVSKRKLADSANEDSDVLIIESEEGKRKARSGNRSSKRSSK